MAEDATTTTWKNNEGCSWTSRKDELAVPDAKWSGCSNLDGDQDVSPRKGTLWPLAVGNEWQYSFQGSNWRGNRWDSTRVCRVESAVRIKLRSGEHDTFKVVCKDTWNTRTLYVDPAQHIIVLYKRSNSRDEDTFELVRREN